MVFVNSSFVLLNGPPRPWTFRQANRFLGGESVSIASQEPFNYQRLGGTNTGRPSRRWKAGFSGQGFRAIMWDVAERRGYRSGEAGVH